MFKTNALDSVSNEYVDEEPATSTPGTRLEADDRNIVQDELVNAVESSGQTLDGSGTFTNNDQLAQAMATYGGGGASFAVDTGVADAYVLALAGDLQHRKEYFDGLELTFIVDNANTGASTVNYEGLGLKDIKTHDGSVLYPRALDGLITIIYSEPEDYFLLKHTNQSNSVSLKSTLITSSTTFQHDPRTIMSKFTAIGGGGGGGGTDGQGSGTAVSGRAGAGAGWCIKNVNNPTGDYVILIGALGDGGLSGVNSGGDGGDTTVVGSGIDIVANGGSGGIGIAGTSGSITGIGTEGGESSGGDINGKGLSAHVSGVNSAKLASTSISGVCPIFGGGVRAVSASSGLNAEQYGEGGGASYGIDSATNYTGGDGFQGVVIIEELLGA